MRIASRAGTIGAVAMALGAGCARKPNAYVAPPPPEVTVARPAMRTITDSLDFTGRTRANQSVEVRARVKGFIGKRHVEGGQRVKAGDLLYAIDPRTFEASVRQAEASLTARRAELALAETSLARVSEALKSNAISKQDVDKAAAERDVARAQVALGEANLTAANLDLEFTRVRSPIDGRLDLFTVDEGALVGANEATLLARVTNDSKVYLQFAIDERQLIRLRETNQNRRPGENDRPRMKALLGLADDDSHPYEGWFSGADSGVDPSTGTILVEAEFDNAGGALLPGYFGRVRLPLAERQATLTPDIAVLTDQKGRYVLTVGADGTVRRKDVRVGPVVDRMRVIEEGLGADDDVIVNGIQRARPGAKVNPVRQGAQPAPAGAAG